VEGKAGRFTLDPVSFQVFHGKGNGSFTADLTGENPAVFARFSLTDFSSEDLWTASSKGKRMKGEMNFTADLNARGKDLKAMKLTLDGEVSLRGGNLTLTSLDLDSLLEQYRRSQEFNLVDVGAFFVAGPAGPAITKGYNFGSILGKAHGGQTEVRQLVSRWRLHNGVARAQDVALSTSKNRIAAHGALDFVNNRFNDLVVAVVNEKGCATVSQKIHGPFRHPKVDRPDFIETLTGPVLKLFRGAAKLLTGSECKVFYEGTVSAPEK
jgi:AsmA protein